jgi:cell division protein FtsL
MRARGRYLVFAWTAVFLAAVGAIVLRDGAAYPARRHLEQLNDSIKALEGTRTDLQARIEALRSWDSLTPKVQALGLRFATDSEVVQLPAPVRH